MASSATQSDPHLLRDPFAWRECLTPQSVSPATSRGGSRVPSQSGTPRDASGTPRDAGNTPPTSPGTPATATPTQISERESIRSTPSAGPRDRNHFSTPQSSARQSEYASVYDSTSVCGTARTDFDTVYEDQAPIRRTSSIASNQSYHRAFAAAFDTFMEPGAAPLAAPERRLSSRLHQTLGQVEEAGPAAPEPTSVSLEPRNVFSAARHGKHKEIDVALQEGFDPNTVDNFGNTIFHIACQNGNKRIAKAAIKYGGNMEAQNKKGNTGLHFLFAYGYHEIAEYFIEKGASEDITNDNGHRPRDGLK